MKESKKKTQSKTQSKKQNKAQDKTQSKVQDKIQGKIQGKTQSTTVQKKYASQERRVNTDKSAKRTRLNNTGRVNHADIEKVSWKPGNMIYPLPAVMASCMRKGEKPNIITVAWTGTVNTNPPMVYISVRPSRYSHAIISETKEFVINLTTEALTYAADLCGVKSGRDVDKFKECGLTPSPSETVEVPGILESPVNIECKVKDVIRLGSHDMFLSEVTRVKVTKSLLDKDDRLKLNDSGLIAYSHGSYYTLGEQLGKFGYSAKRKKKK